MPTCRNERVKSSVLERGKKLSREISLGVFDGFHNNVSSFAAFLFSTTMSKSTIMSNSCDSKADLTVLEKSSPYKNGLGLGLEKGQISPLHPCSASESKFM